MMLAPTIRVLFLVILLVSSTLVAFLRTLPEQENNGVPIPPAVVLDKVSTRSRIKDPANAANALPSCLYHPSNGVDDDCWNEFRRKQYLELLDAIYKFPVDQLGRFNPHVNWQIFDLITPTYQCDANSLQRVGPPGEGGKWLCGPVRVTGPKCVIFSLGSNNQFEFEEAMDEYAEGQCEIHTFDCTGHWSNPHTHFHPWCLGGSDTNVKGTIFKRLSTAAKELGVSSISLLKMDIEHAEYEVFDGLKHEPEEFLPDQILFELHTWNHPSISAEKNWPRTIINLVRDIDSMGYSFAFLCLMSSCLLRVCHCPGQAVES